MGALSSKVIWGQLDEDDPSGAAQMANEPAELEVRVTLAEGATLPDYKTTGAAGMDLHALERHELRYGETVLVDTGVSMALPYLLYGQIMGRSGLAAHHGISVHPGVVDTDYRGRIKILMTRWQGVDEPYVVEPGDRIAQLLILPVARPMLITVTDLDETERGEGGFGSTGRAAAVAEEAPAPASSS